MKSAMKKSFLFLARRGFLNWMSDEQFLKLKYWANLGKELNLATPCTFNEKLQWLKLYDRKPEHTTMVDKYAVKEYVANIIGEEHIIPTLGVWDTFDDIDFDSLPDQFVLKCTHDSGGLVICKDKKALDLKATKRKLSKCLKTNYFFKSREWPYKDVTPRILAEKYMVDEKIGELRDYKFFCFHGQVKCFKVDFDRNVEHRANYYDPKGNLLYFGETVCPPDYEKEIELPNTLCQMEEYAERLSANCPFLRVDFYDVNGNVYFGELTFFPNSGFGSFTDDRWDYQMGEWLSL